MLDAGRALGAAEWAKTLVVLWSDHGQVMPCCAFPPLLANHSYIRFIIAHKMHLMPSALANLFGFVCLLGRRFPRCPCMRHTAAYLPPPVRLTLRACTRPLERRGARNVVQDGGVGAQLAGRTDDKAGQRRGLGYPTVLLCGQDVPRPSGVARHLQDNGRAVRPAATA